MKEEKGTNPNEADLARSLPGRAELIYERERSSRRIPSLDFFPKAALWSF